MVTVFPKTEFCPFSRIAAVKSCTRERSFIFSIQYLIVSYLYTQILYIELIIKAVSSVQSRLTLRRPFFKSWVVVQVFGVTLMPLRWFSNIIAKLIVNSYFISHKNGKKKFDQLEYQLQNWHQSSLYNISL